MDLPENEKALFIKLHSELIHGINEQYKIISHIETPAHIAEVAHRLWENPHYINEFLSANDNGEFTETERGIFLSWRKNFIKSEFLIIKHVKNKYSVLMPFNERNKLYAVLGIKKPVAVMHYDSPPLCQMVILPFNGKIVFDNFCVKLSDAYFTQRERRHFEDDYKQIKSRIGITESIGNDGTSYESKVIVPVSLSPLYNEISEIITKFCDDKFHKDYNDEFKEICLYALAKLCKNNPILVKSGVTKTLACAIVYEIGSCNFFQKEGMTYHIGTVEFAESFGLSASKTAIKTLTRKAEEVRNALKSSPYKAEYRLKRKAKTGDINS